MRTFGLLAWLMVPVLAGAYHYGPGQEKLQLDNVSRLLADADRLTAEQQWSQASSRYESALAQLPAGRVDEARRIRLQRAKVQMLDRQLPEASVELNDLVSQLENDKSADPKLRDDAMNTLAASQYYMTWLMRLEGLSEDEWGPEIENARQTHRLLAEKAEAEGDQTTAKQQREDLESAIRLARLDVDDLQGLDIPKQCQGCKSGQCKKPGKKPGKGQRPKEKDGRGAGTGPPPDNSGS